MIGIDPMKFLVEITPLPTEEKGGCAGCFIQVLLIGFILWIGWQLLKWLGIVLLKYVLPAILIIVAIYGVLVVIGKIFDI